MAVGDTYGRNNRYAALLAPGPRDLSNVESDTQGLAYMLRSGLQGMFEGKDRKAKQDANRAFVDGMRGTQWKNPDMGGKPLIEPYREPGMQGPLQPVPTSGTPGGLGYAQKLLSDPSMADNEYAADMNLQLMMQNMTRQQQLADTQSNRDFTSGQAAIGRKYDQENRSQDRDYVVADQATSHANALALANSKQASAEKIATDRLNGEGKYYAVSTGNGIMIMEKGSGVAQMLGVSEDGTLTARGQPFQAMNGPSGNATPVPQSLGPQMTGLAAPQPPPASTPLMPPSLAVNPQADVAGARQAATSAAISNQKKINLLPKAQSALVSLEQQTELVTSTIDKAIARISGWTTGAGHLLAMMPNTDARALDNDLNTIKANVGFDKLQNMRDNSPTGGALGQVSEFENKLLQAVNGALDPLQREQLEQNLMQIRRLYPAVLAERKRAFQLDFKDQLGEQPAASSPDPLGIR